MSADLGMDGASRSKRRAYFTQGTLVAFFCLFLAAAWVSTASGNAGYVTKLSDANRFNFGNVNISPDGHLASYSDGHSNYFVKDLDDGAVTSTSGLNDFSADNRFRAFSTYRNDLVPGDTNGATDIFVEDAQTHIITRASTTSAGEQAYGPCSGCDSQAPSISADGRYVVFSSFQSGLVPGDTNDSQDIFMKDLLTGATTRVSTASDGAQATAGCPDLSDADCGSANPTISADGRFVAFTSEAIDLVPDDTNGIYDIFVKDLQTGTTTRVSTLSDGQQQTMGSCSIPYPFCGSYSSAISADGRYVAFDSFASNLTPAGGDGQSNVFVKDTLTGATTLVSTDTDGNRLPAYSPSISADGGIIAFSLSDMQGIGIKNVSTGDLDRLYFSGSATLSADGKHFVFGRFFYDYNEDVPGAGLYVGATDACTETFGADLTLRQDRVYWPSYQDYANRTLGVDFSVANHSANPAYSLIITGFTTTDYATLRETLPVYTGTDIYPGGQGQFTLHFGTGPGVSHFITNLQAHSRNNCAVETVHPH